jgi:hypothetical protein
MFQTFTNFKKCKLHVLLVISKTFKLILANYKVNLTEIFCLPLVAAG